MKKSFLFFFLSFLVFLAATGIFFEARKGGFVYDDLPAVVKNPDVVENSLDLREVFTHDFWGQNLTSSKSHKSYRPLTILYFKALKYLSSSSSSSYLFHSFNVIFHGLNSVLVFTFVKSLKLHKKHDIKFAWISSLFFGLHPVHSESVVGVVGAADLIYSFLTLSGLILIVRLEGSKLAYGTCSVLCLASVLFKEQGIMLLPLVFFTDSFVLVGLDKTRLRSVIMKLAFCFGFCVLILIGRLWIMDFSTPEFQRGDNPISFLEDPFLRIINFNYIYALNAWLLLNPNWLCFDWSMGSVPIIREPFLDVRVFAVIFLWIFCILVKQKLSFKKRSKNFIISLVYVILPFLPASNILFRVGFVVAERNLYLSVLGFGLLVTRGYFILLKRFKNLTNFLMGLTLVCFSFKSYLRTLEWKDEMTLFKTGLRVNPLNAKIHYNIAKKTSDIGNDFETVVKSYEKALELWPEYEHAFNNLGNVLRDLGQGRKATSLFKKALEINPEFSAAWMNLGIAEMNLGNFEEAEKAYFNALSHRKPYPESHYNLGNLYLKTGQKQKALKAFKKAISLNPKLIQAWTNLVILLDEMEKFDLAEKTCLEAIAQFPENDSEFKFHLANIYGKDGKFEKAEKLYLEAQSKGQKSIYFLNLGVLYHRWRKFDLAEQYYRLTLKMDPANPSAKKHLAALLPKRK